MPSTLVKPTLIQAVPVGTLFDRLTSQQAIELLVSAKERESQVLEYKTIGPKGPNHLDYAATVAAFANTFGGTLVLGVATGKGADQDVPIALEPIDPKHADAVLQAIGARVRHPVEGMRQRRIGAGAGREYFVLDVPQSPMSPHQVIEKGVYYRRDGSRDVPMSHDLVELYFGRRAGPVLVVAPARPAVIQRSEGIGVAPGSTAFRFRVVLRNLGRRAAHHAYACVRVPRDVELPRFDGHVV